MDLRRSPTRPFAQGIHRSHWRTALLGLVQERKLLTQINGLYRIVQAFEQTYAMVRNSTKLVTACIVLGVVNQACAVGSIGKAPPDEDRSATGTQVADTTGRRDTAPPVPASQAKGGPEPATVATNPLKSSTAAPALPAVPPGGVPDVSAAKPAAPAKAATPSAEGSKTADMPPQDTSVAAIVPAAPAKAPDPATLPTAAAAVTPVATQLPAPLPVIYSDTPRQALPGNLWDRIRVGYAMAEVESPLVQRHMTWYLNRPEYLERMVERSRRYLHFIVEELEQRGMPLEIALLPMIESAYNPVAYSRAHASGIWQFIPDTGRRYGLEQNWWYDGRRDVTAATSAALDYLQKLHGDFGDWQLALAAYNWGEGAVSRAIEKNQRLHKPTNYRSLKMPKETANYLPKLQAVKNIIADPARYGITLDEIPNRPYFIRVNAPAHIDVKRAAQLAEVPLEEFRNLNPAHNRPVISSDGARTLLLPVEKAAIFANNLEANDAPLVSWQTYTLKPNEKLDKVAARYGISVNTLKQVNGIGTRKRLRPGQTLLVPTPAAMQNVNLEQSLDPLEFQPPTAGPEMETYRVTRSDSLQRIANQFRVTPRQITRWNGLRGGHIAVGQQLTIYPDTAPAARSSSSARTAKHSQAVTAKKSPAAAAPRKKQIARN
jgi:membrane-bound lytic murein transglycosylase D